LVSLDAVDLMGEMIAEKGYPEQLSTSAVPVAAIWRNPEAVAARLAALTRQAHVDAPAFPYTPI
jgi:hypothetical protein